MVLIIGIIISCGVSVFLIGFLIFGFGQEFLFRCIPSFHAYSVALDESTDITDTAQLEIYVRGVEDNFEVMEELLTVIPMHGQTTTQDIFCQLCDAIVDAVCHGRGLLE